jgi:hypothetical protein
MYYLNKYEKIKFWAKVDKTGDCWLWRGTTTTEGYGLFSLQGRQVSAHRVSYCLEYEALYDSLCVCHSCDASSCVNPDHLFLGTRGDNARDMSHKGRICRGERTSTSKLKTEQVVEIKRLLREGLMTKLAISREFLVSEVTIYKIQSGKSWKHVT